MIDEATRNQEEGKGGSEPSGIQRPARSIPDQAASPSDLQIDGDGNPTSGPPAPLAIVREKKLIQENQDMVQQIWKPIEQKLARGGQYVLQTGPRMKLFQNTFGSPANKIVMAVTFMKKPQARTPPEPILSREATPLFLELELKTGEWNVTFPWQPYKMCTYNKKPDAMIVMHGRERYQC